MLDGSDKALIVITFVMATIASVVYGLDAYEMQDGLYTWLWGINAATYGYFTYDIGKKLLYLGV